MTESELIDGILTREGGFTNNPHDAGGPTNFGITAASWGTYARLGRVATADEVGAISRDQAIAYYRSTYVDNGPFAAIDAEPLRVQLIDFAVNSGTSRAIRWLQRTIGVPVTGVLDVPTHTAVSAAPPVLINNALVAARISMYSGIVENDSTQAVFLRGWIARALTFMQLDEPAPAVHSATSNA
jgi:lysozyme family protein